MKSRRFKHAICGAIILGMGHLILSAYLIIEGGEALITLTIIDFPLYPIGLLVSKFVLGNPRISEEASNVAINLLFLIGGTLVYALFGSILGIILEKIDRICEKIR